MNGYWPALSTLAQHLPDIGSVSACTARPAAQQTRGVEPVLVLCWASVADSGPELNQHLVFAESVDRAHCDLHITGCEDDKTVAQLIEPKDDLVTVDHLPSSKS